MSFILVGELIRYYHEEHCYDEGEVQSVIDGVVTVDFYDWIERLPEYDVTLDELYSEGKEVLLARRHGEIVVDFR